MVVVEENLAIQDSLHEKASERGGASDEIVWDPQVNFLSTTDSCDHALTLEAYDDDIAMINTGTLIDYSNDWKVDSGSSNHMTSDVKKFRSMRPYEGNQVVVTSDNSQHPVKHIGDAKIATRFGGDHVLHGVYHVPGMAKNLLLVCQTIGSGRNVLFGPDDV